MSVVEEKKFVMRHVFADVMNEKTEKEEKHFGVSWKLYILRGYKRFAVEMFCYPPCSIETEIEFKFISGDKQQKSVISKHIFEKNNYIHRLCIINKERIQNYLVGGNLTVECHVQITKITEIFKKKPRNFDESMKKFSDVVVIVDDEKFYVSKKYLASHSPYFYSLFLENFSEPGQSEITLNDVEPHDFLSFLELIFGEDPITDHSVNGILKLAFIFDSQTAIRRCEEFLIKESKQSLKEKFQEAAHKLETLRAKRLIEQKIRTDIWSSVPEDSNQIDSQTWKELLNDALHLLDNSFGDGKLKIENPTRIIKMTGIVEKLKNFYDESMKESSDIVLIVGDKKFYVLKTYLASHSSYFESLFNGNFNESTQSEITLHDIDPKSFQKFLELIYGESSIDDMHVFGILELADMYDSQTAIRKCEEFLMKESKHSLEEKFETAMQYKMDELKKKCISDMKTLNDILSVVPEDPSQIDPPTWKELLRRALHLDSLENTLNDWPDFDFSH